MARVDFCRRNLDQYGRTALHQFEQTHPDIPVFLWGCLDKCDFCRQHAFARIDRQPVLSAPNAAELLEQLNRYFEPNSDV